jgi:hypothetical protein
MGKLLKKTKIELTEDDVSKLIRIKAVQKILVESFVRTNLLSDLKVSKETLTNLKGLKYSKQKNILVLEGDDNIFIVMNILSKCVDRDAQHTSFEILIKVPVKIKAKNNSITQKFLEDNEKDTNASRNKKQISKQKRFIKYKRFGINDWDMDCFLGLYLNLYVDLFGKEDPEFLFPSVEIYKYSAMIRSTLINVFNNDKQKLKSYIEIIMPWIVSDESWTDKTISFYQIFGKKCCSLVKQFDKIQSQGGKKLTARQQDDYWANHKNWQK